MRAARSRRRRRPDESPDLPKPVPVASTSQAAHQPGPAVFARLLICLAAQPGAKAGDLGAIRRAFGRDQPVAEARSFPDPVAAIAGMAAETAGDQQVDLALDQLVQA